MNNKFPVMLPAKARILVIKLAGIGDGLLITPALRALRETYPDADIDLLTRYIPAQVLQDWDVLNDIIVINPRPEGTKPDQKLTLTQRLSLLNRLLKRLQAKHYSAVLLFHHLLPLQRGLTFQALMLATRARWRVGLDNGQGWFLNVKAQDNGFGSRHEAEHYLAVAEAFGATTPDKHLHIPLSDEERQQAQRIVYGCDEPITQQGPIIAMHPGCSVLSTARRWAPERFAQLADTLYHDFGGQLLLLGGSDEAPLREEIMRLMRSDMPRRSLSGEESIKLTAAIIEQCDLFVGNDSGLMHLATAVDTPIVAIFGLTNHKAWGPYTGNMPGRATVVHLDLPCMPCYFRGRTIGTPEGCATRDCLTQLQVKPVAAAARKMLMSWLEANNTLSLLPTDIQAVTKYAIIDYKRAIKKKGK
jgi:lipopolysaccharide heptosyltransferase II